MEQVYSILSTVNPARGDLFGWQLELNAGSLGKCPTLTDKPPGLVLNLQHPT